MAITFNGATRVITLSPGESEVDVSEIYAAWKTWAAQSDNLGFLQAFRTVGGDPLSAIINAGAYYFLRNDLGWRIKPPEENITVYLTGNLAVQDSSLPAFLPTDGTFTVALLGLQPVTQGVTPAMRTQLEYGAFQNAVTLDSVNGFSGDVGPDGLTPVGTKQFPCLTLMHAESIASERGLRQIDIVGSYTVTAGDVIDGFVVMGDAASRSHVVLEPDAVVTNNTFRSLTLSGHLDGGNNAENCTIGTLNYIDGSLSDCFLGDSTITVSGTQANFLRCSSAVAGGGPGQTPRIDMGGGGTNLVMREYSGGIEIFNHVGGMDSVSIDLISGRVILASSIQSGDYTLRGVGLVEDNSGGVSVVDSQVISPETLRLALDHARAANMQTKTA